MVKPWSVATGDGFEGLVGGELGLVGRGRSQDPDGELVAQAFDDSIAVVVERGETKPCPPREVPDFDRCSAAVDGVRYRVFDRSVEAGKRILSPAEEIEIRAEMAQVQQILKAREG